MHNYNYNGYSAGIAEKSPKFGELIRHTGLVSLTALSQDKTLSFRATDQSNGSPQSTCSYAPAKPGVYFDDKALAFAYS